MAEKPTWAKTPSFLLILKKNQTLLPKHTVQDRSPSPWRYITLNLQLLNPCIPPPRQKNITSYFKRIQGCFSCPNHSNSSHSHNIHIHTLAEVSSNPFSTIFHVLIFFCFCWGGGGTITITK